MECGDQQLRKVGGNGSSTASGNEVSPLGTHHWYVVL